jgi:WD40 repeat protein
MLWRIVRAVTGEVIIGTSGVFTIDPRSGTTKFAPTTGHKAQGISVRFSPDGTRLVSGAADGTATVWDPQTLDNLLTAATASEANPIPVAPIFTQGSDLIAIPSYDGKTYHWDTSTARILNQACVMAGRNLTASEWAQMFPNLHYQETCP